MKKLNSVGIIKNNKKLNISFVEYPQDVESITFESNGVKFILESEKLKTDAENQISKLYNAFNSENSEELEVLLENKKTMHIDSKGNHIRFSLKGKEKVYWVSDEIMEDPINVLGAIAGCIYEF